MLAYRKMFDDYRHDRRFDRDLRRHHDRVIDCEIDHDRLDHLLVVSGICIDLWMATLRD